MQHLACSAQTLVIDTWLMEVREISFEPIFSVEDR
jgi:hypothetical protein